ncbi:MAG: tetratricopeptide repeat protein [bacterium]
MAQKRVVEAEWYYKKAITLEPEYWEAYVNLANLYFLNKQYKFAWDYYEYRFLKNIAIKNRFPNISKPIWDGSSLIGKTICVYGEQGLGDIINFIRYVPVLFELGAKVILKLHSGYSSLEKLFKDSNLKAEILDNSLDDENIECDTHISVMSLPHRLKTTIDNIPYKDHYLKAEPEKVKYYRNKYFDNDDFKLGIVWNCKNKEVNDKYRSLNDLSYFYPFCKLANVQVYSLQKGDGVDDLNNLPDDINIIDLGSTFNDFSDTAAAIENLDLVISIDTSVPHLAGALGKPTWILLSYIHSWRWTYDLEISPWYDSVKLFRQKQQNVWVHPVQEAYEHFKFLIQSRKN